MKLFERLHLGTTGSNETFIATLRAFRMWREGV